MDENNQGVEQSKQPVQAETNAQTEAPTVTEQQPTIAEDELPNEPDKQREAFIKMRQELKAKEDLLRQYESPEENEVDIIKQFQQGAYIPNNAPITPETDLSEFANRVSQSEQVAYQANQRVAQLEQQLEEQRLYAEFPELNPKSEQYKQPQTKAFEEYIAGKAAVEILKGRRPDIISIAKKAKDTFSGMTTAQKEAIAKEVTAEMQAKENATMEATGSSFVQNQSQDMTAINHKINRGDMEALALRLKNRG